MDGSHLPTCIVVVDNASRQEEVAVLHELAARVNCVELLLSRENTGYFPGLNLGIERIVALAPDVSYVIIGNNDLVFPPEFGDALSARAAAISQYPVVSPNVITLDGVHQNPHVITRISRVREMVYDVYYSSYLMALMIRWLARLTHRLTDRDDEDQYERAQFIHQGHGSVYILTPAFFRDYGKLWAPTFLMGEEYFLSRQLEEKGMQVFYDPLISVQHHCNGAIGNLPSRMMWGIARDAHRVYRRYVSPWRRDFHRPV
jgi:GT2 family glycosyltransferase